MTRKTHIDLFGATALVLFALHLAFNQVVIKVTGGGFAPVFAAGLRSAGAVAVLLVWMYARGVRLHVPRAAWRGGVLCGLLFAFEFMCVFNAVDVTDVSRATVIFYSMPVWLALAGHFLFQDERLTRVKAAGLLAAMGGVVLALSDRGGGMVSWTGDLLALAAAFGWMGIVLCVRLTALSQVPPVVQLLFQVSISALVLLVAAPLFGPLTRGVETVHVAGLLFQIIAVASLGYLFWFWLIGIYPASSVASFSFLTPVAAVVLGWLLLGEEVGLRLWLAVAMVAAGIYLINRREGGKGRRASGLS